MQDSTDTRITYRAILERAEQCARDAMPDFPKVSTAEAWEDYIAEIEALDAYEIAYQSAEWDWVIYYHHAMALCQAVPSDVLHQAEVDAFDSGGTEHLQGYGCNKSSDNFGLYEMAALIAAQIVTREIVDAVEQVRDELLELANDKLEQLESESVA